MMRSLKWWILRLPIPILYAAEAVLVGGVLVLLALALPRVAAALGH